MALPFRFAGQLFPRGSYLVQVNGVRTAMRKIDFLAEFEDPIAA